MKQIRDFAIYLASIEIWPVGLFVAASFISARLLPVALVIAALFWLIRWLAYGKLSYRTLADWPVFLLFLMMPVTLWATSLPEITVTQVYRLLTGIAIYYAIANWTTTRRRLSLVVTGAVATGLILALSAPLSVTWSTGKLPFIPEMLYSRFTVIISDTIHPNVMAGSLVILLQIPLAWLFFSWRSINRWQRVLAIVAVLGMSSILLLTKSRGAWMAFAITLVFMILLRWRWGWVSLLIGGLAGGIGVYILGINALLEYLLRSDTIGGIDGRIEIWSRAIYMIQDFPFTGIGMGSFTKVADTLYPFFLASPGQIAHAHNLFLQIAVDLGIPGLIAWLAVLLLVVAQAWQVYRFGKTGQDALATGLGVGLLGSQLALVVHGMTDAVTWGMVKPAPLVWVVWGLAIAGGNIYRNSMKNKQAQPNTALGQD